MRLQFKAEKLQEERDKELTGHPVTNVKLDNIRSIEDYYNDQLITLENKQAKLEELLRQEESFITGRPEISDKSRQLALKKQGDKDEDLFSRLYQERIHTTNPVHHINEEIINKKKTMNNAINQNYRAINADNEKLKKKCAETVVSILN